MPIGNVGVLRIGMQLLPVIGQQPAATPMLPSAPPVGIQELPTGTSGAVLASWAATSGTVTIKSAQNIGQREQFGMMSGTIDAWLAKSGGGPSIHLTGSWACVVEPVVP